MTNELNIYKNEAKIGGGRYIDALRADALTSRMLDFVGETLAPVDALSKSGAAFPFRSRFAHTKRVVEWALRLYGAEGGDPGVIAVAAIFHDAGYSRPGEGHAAESARIFTAYAARCGGVRSGGAAAHGIIGAAARNETGTVRNETDAAAYGIIGAAARAAMASESGVERIRRVIASHSDKHLYGADISLEEKIMIDADLLDEIGAMSVLWDCFSEAQKPAYDFTSAYEVIAARFADDEREAARFRTAEGLRRFMEMRRYVGAFIDGLKTEINYG